MSDFKKGDRVRVTAGYASEQGNAGVIRKLESDAPKKRTFALVEMDGGVFAADAPKVDGVACHRVDTRVLVPFEEK